MSLSFEEVERAQLLRDFRDSPSEGGRRVVPEQAVVPMEADARGGRRVEVPTCLEDFLREPRNARRCDICHGPATIERARKRVAALERSRYMYAKESNTAGSVLSLRDAA